MNTDEFKENYNLDRDGRAYEKRGKAAPVFKTADGEIFDHSKTYFFFDERACAVRQSLGLVPNNNGYLCGANNFKVIEIARLRNDKDKALSDGQKHFSKEIKKYQNLIAEFELAKTVKSRSLKTYLMAKE